MIDRNPTLCTCGTSFSHSPRWSLPQFFQVMRNFYKHTLLMKCLLVHSWSFLGFSHFLAHPKYAPRDAAPLLDRWTSFARFFARVWWPTLQSLTGDFRHISQSCTLENVAKKMWGWGQRAGSCKMAIPPTHQNKRMIPLQEATFQTLYSPVQYQNGSHVSRYRILRTKNTRQWYCPLLWLIPRHQSCLL